MTDAPPPPLTNICRHCQRVIRRVERDDGSAHWLHEDGHEGYLHCRAGTTAGPPNPTDDYSPSRDMQAIANSLMDTLAEGLRKGAEAVAHEKAMRVAPLCINHRERQHRDQQPPWCNECGWTRGREAIPAAKLGITRREAAADRLGDVP